jgi:hypothetical protein
MRNNDVEISLKTMNFEGYITNKPCLLQFVIKKVRYVIPLASQTNGIVQFDYPQKSKIFFITIKCTGHGAIPCDAFVRARRSPEERKPAEIKGRENQDHQKK